MFVAIQPFFPDRFLIIVSREVAIILLEIPILWFYFKTMVNHIDLWFRLNPFRREKTMAMAMAMALQLQNKLMYRSRTSAGL